MSKTGWTKELFQFKRLNHQIFFLMIICITIPLLVISIVIYIYSVQTVKNEYQNSSDLLLNNLSFNIDQYLQSIEMATLTAQMDGHLHTALENWSENDLEQVPYESILYEKAIENFISTIEVSIKNIDSVQIYVGNRVFYSTISNRETNNFTNVIEQRWYKQTIEKQGSIAIFGTHQPFHRASSNQPVISIARVINKSGTKKPLGVLLIDIRLDSLREILTLSENSNRNFVILDKNGNVIYSTSSIQLNESMSLEPHSQSLLAVLENETGSYFAPVAGVHSMINYVTSPYSGWRVVQYIDEKEVTKQAGILREIILGLAFISIGTAVLFMYILYSRVTKPIILLSKQVELIGKGKFNVNLNLNSNRQDEFGLLYHGIQGMVVDIQNYIERSSALKAKQKVAHYRALKSQINPHFLANTLSTIQMKAVINKQPDIEEMISLLGLLFRSYIQTGKEIVTLKEELSHTRIYVQVQQMRFGNKIKYEETLAPGSENIEIIHFSLQPIVENAIVHGLETKGGSGTINVSTEIMNNDLIVSIIDDGIGMNEEQLQDIHKHLSQSKDTFNDEHIGIKNIHNQIKFYFGEQYGIEIRSTLGEGTTVTLRIPAKKRD